MLYKKRKIWGAMLAALHSDYETEHTRSHQSVYNGAVNLFPVVLLYNNFIQTTTKHLVYNIRDNE
jgi:hypothetical protein